MILVDTEINRLQKVIIHRPDSGIERITPKRAEELLFDDIVHLPQMIAEHDTFRRILDCFVGKENVLEIQDLLFEALEANQELRLNLINWIIEFEELPDKLEHSWSKMDNELLAELFITGYNKKTDYILFDPVPNLIFTRDIAVTVKDHIVITKAFSEARKRENYLTRFIFDAHPYFAKLHDKLINLSDINIFPPSQKGERVSIEGGDMMVIEKDYLLIGCSERTSRHAFQSLKDYLIKHNIIKHVVQVNIPVERSYMHIDTLFTRISKDDLACFKPIIYDGLGSNVLVHTKNGLKADYVSVKDFFINEINPKMNFIFVGNGESPYQEREQWTDGCNLVAVKPGVAITYDRNVKTEIAFKNAGYQIITSDQFMQNQATIKNYIEDVEKTIITIPSGELSRARGGSHCMTCPLQRAIL